MAILQGDYLHKYDYKVTFSREFRTVTDVWGDDFYNAF